MSKKKTKNRLEYCEIYIIKNTINVSVYIGQSWQGAKVRFRSHKNDKYGHCVKLFNAMNAHGKDNFYYEILATCKTVEDANFIENYLIKEYGSIENGYNIKDGGSNGSHSEETKLKISKALKGKNAGENNGMYGKSGELNPMFGIRLVKELNGMYGKKHTDETKKKISEAISGEKSPMFGKHLSEETKKKISEAQLGEKHHNFGKHLSDETKAKMSMSLSGSNNGNFGKKLSDEIKKKISNAHMGISLSEEHCQKISEGNKGKIRTEEQCLAQSKRMSGEGNHFYGKKQKPESIAKREATRKLNMQIKKISSTTATILCINDILFS